MSTARGLIQPPFEAPFPEGQKYAGDLSQSSGRELQDFSLKGLTGRNLVGIKEDGKGSA
jgi:hypothetical protein